MTIKNDEESVIIITGHEFVTINYYTMLSVFCRFGHGKNMLSKK